MRQRHRYLAIPAIAVMLAGCFGGTAATPSSTITLPPPSETSAPASEPAETSAATVEPVPSEDLEPVSCDLPIHVDATVGHTNIADVRIGTHADYDRVVFEFTDGIPEASLDRAEPPFSQDGSGFPIEVDGESFLQLTMRGGTKQMEDGSSSYDGPTEFTPGFPTLVHLVEAGDFEAQSTWIFGLSSEACVRVLTLTDDGAPRLVIDVEH
jgi:hypothetical protein